MSGRYVIEVWEYDWGLYIGLVFRFRNFWSREVKISKHKRACYKRIFYATNLKRRIEDRKMISPTRIINEQVEWKRLKEKVGL